MGKTTKVNKDMSLANNLILENDLSVLSVRLYTDINGILFILGLTLFISLVNSFLILFNKGSRVPIRGKVNEALTTGLRVVDTILPIGRGQRQVIIGDRFTGKTTVIVNTMINQNRNNYLKSVEGFGSKRVFGV